MHLLLSGIPIWYNRCERCGLLFTTAFDDWQVSDYQQAIYNQAYERVDPDYVSRRAEQNADMIASMLPGEREVRLMDYGGGNGTLSRLLQARGLDAHSWDPMNSEPFPQDETFSVVTAFEVFEHTPDPHETLHEALALLEPEGVLLFSTLLMEQADRRLMDHWYIAPRNGHITLHTRRSLAHLFAEHGCQVNHLSNSLHLAKRHHHE